MEEAARPPSRGRQLLLVLRADETLRLLQTCAELLQGSSPWPGTGDPRIRPSSWLLGAYVLVKLMDVYSQVHCTQKLRGGGSRLVQAKGIREVFPKGNFGMWCLKMSSQWVPENHDGEKLAQVRIVWALCGEKRKMMKGEDWQGKPDSSGFRCLSEDEGRQGRAVSMKCQWPDLWSEKIL